MINTHRCLFGPLLGIVLACGLLSAATPPVAASQIPPSNAVAANGDSGRESAFLRVFAPLDGEVVSISPVHIVGQTNVGRLVVVNTDNDEEFIGHADDGGWFSLAVELWPGFNELLVLSLVEGDWQAPVAEAELLVILQQSSQR